MNFEFIISDLAKAKISKAIKSENLKNGKFGIFLSLSQSTGFQFGFTIDDEVNDDDFVINCQYNETSFEVLIDTYSAQNLNGATLNCKVEEGKEIFTISHSSIPN